VELGTDLLLEAADALLEELVEVGGDDPEELHPLEQRDAVVLRLVEHPPAEVEVGELAVEVELGGVQRGRGEVPDPGSRRGPAGGIDQAQGRSSHRLGGLGYDLEPMAPRVLGAQSRTVQRHSPGVYPPGDESVTAR
jgi:hypothetical protein